MTWTPESRRFSACALPLGAVADDGDRLSIELVQIAILLVVDVAMIKTSCRNYCSFSRRLPAPRSSATMPVRHSSRMP